MQQVAKVNWEAEFSSLSPQELDKLALLRVIECSNGVVQHLFRANDERALPVEQTREIMNFSMGCMKHMEIPLSSGSVSFEENTQKLMHRVRDLYIQGFKHGDEESEEEFLRASEANFKAIGKARLEQARLQLEGNTNVLTPKVLDWGMRYILFFASDSLH